MKKITPVLAFLFASIVAFGQAGNITSKQIDTLSPTGIQSKSGLVTAYNNLKSLIAPAKKPLGTVVNNSLTSSTGYTAAGSTTTWSFTGSGLTTSGGSNDNSNTQTWTGYYTNATNYAESITFKPTAYGNGIGIGLNSNNGQIIGRMSLSGGIATLYIDDYRSATIYNKVTGSNTLTFALNDNIQLTLYRFNYDWYLFANDITSGVSVSCQVSDPLSYGEIAFEWASANPAIFHYGGSQTITNHNLTINNLVGNDFVIVGNSISVGMQSGSPNNTFASLLGQYYNGGVNLEGGGGNTTSNDVQLLPEIVALHPRFLIFTDGVNDAVSGYSAATSEANMQTIITTCISNNITPVFCTILPLTAAYGGASNSTYQAAIVTLNTYINGLKNVIVVDTYTALASGSVLNASYDSGDGIHINTAGHLQYYNTLYNTLSGNYMVNVTPNPTTAILSTSNNWTGNPQTITINGLGAATSDAWKLVNTTSATSGTPQYSPDILFGGTAYNTTSLASQTFNWKMFATGTAGNPIASNVYLTSSLNGAGYITNQYGWSAVGVYTAPTFSSTSTGGASAFQSYNASATSSNLYVLASGGNTLGAAATNFAGASYINYRWFMSGGTAITPGGGNAVTGGIIGTQHVTYPSTGTTPLISQLVIKPVVVDGSSGAIVTNTATLELEGAATGTVTGANYDLWAHGLNRLDSLATPISGLIKGNGVTSPATAAVANIDYLPVSSPVMTTPTLGVASATKITFSAGTTTVAPIVFASGTNLTSATAGAVEYNGTKLFYTDATPTRHTIMNLDQNQTVTGTLTLTTPNIGAATATSLTIGTLGTGLVHSSSAGLLSSSLLVNADITAGTITPASMQNSDDNTYRALQLLGSSIKGYTVGFPVLPSSNAIALTSGTITWTAVYVPVGQTLTGIKVDISTAGSYTSTGYNGVALYSISGGTLTQVATSTTSTTVWTGSGWVSIPFASTYTATEGVYFVAMLYQQSAQTTAPKINAISTPGGYPALDFTNSYKLGGTSSGTTLPSSQAASGITAASTQYHILLY